MTDKDKLAKVRAEIERRIALYSGLSEETVNPNRIDEDRQILSFINTLQKEPTTSVWHNITEEPKMGKWILLRHSDGWYHVGCMSKGKFDKFWVSDGTAAFLLSAFSKWAYVEDLLKL